MRIIIFIILSCLLYSCSFTSQNSLFSDYERIERTVGNVTYYDYVVDTDNFDDSVGSVNMNKDGLQVVKDIFQTLPELEKYVEDNNSLILDDVIASTLPGLTAYSNKNDIVLNIYQSNICMKFEDIINHKYDREYCLKVSDELKNFVEKTQLFKYDHTFINGISRCQIYFQKAIEDIESSTDIVNVEGAIEFYDKFNQNGIISLNGYDIQQ